MSEAILVPRVGTKLVLYMKYYRMNAKIDRYEDNHKQITRRCSAHLCRRTKMADFQNNKTAVVNQKLAE